MTKSERLVIRLDADDRDWTRCEAERIGVDSATLVRMLIRHARMMEHAPEGVGEEQETVGKAPGPHAVSTDLPGGETSDADAARISAEAAEDLDTLMAAAPSLLDEAAELETPPPRYSPPAVPSASAARYRFQQPSAPAYQPPAIPRRAGLAARQPGVPPGAFRAGSMTRVVGVGEGTAGNITGDGIGNVIRDNFAHLGFVGTRSR